MSSQDPEEERAELVTFQVKAACIYTPLPQATTYGHRAETWDVENFFREVRVRVVSVGDNLYIRLEDLESGELFAECPLPNDGSPLTRAVEPVVDSSRYYVLRVVDRADEKKHAFLGLGFRERGESSAFSAALDDYRIFLRRKAEAEAMRVAFEQGEETPGSPEGGSPSSSSGGSGSGGRRLHSSGSGGGGISGRFALPAGQTISLKLPGANTQGSKSPILGERSGSLEREDKRQVTRVFSLNETIAGVRLLPPPPSAGGLGPRQASGIPAALADWAVFADAKDPLGQELMKRASGEVVKLSEVEGEEETWGEFQATA